MAPGAASHPAGHLPGRLRNMLWDARDPGSLRVDEQLFGWKMVCEEPMAMGSFRGRYFHCGLEAANLLGCAL